MPFTIAAKRTLDFTGATTVHCAQPSEGLEKRQATLMVCFHPASTIKQPALGIVFRGLGQRLSKVERDAIAQARFWMFVAGTCVTAEPAMHALCAL